MHVCLFFLEFGHTLIECEQIIFGGNMLEEIFKKIDEVSLKVGRKILKAMQKYKLEYSHFGGSSGYGYDDSGREVIEKIYAQVFGAEDALVRPQLMSGTHALTVSFFGNLRPGDTLVSVVGKPYDTLLSVIGVRPAIGSLAEYGINYEQVDLLPNGMINFDGILKAITNNKVKMVTIQRSKGYSTRQTLSISEIGKIIKTIKAHRNDIICLVDNCYGEFVEEQEPSEVGADLVVGSLIKNPGGGLCECGGYIVGKAEYVNAAAMRLTAPGLGKEVGATLGTNKNVLQGLFLAPEVVANALKGAIYAAYRFEELGFKTIPRWNESRSDIVQAIEMKNAENVIAFCEGIQKAAPVDSFVKPIPWDMPGYDVPVIMAAGAFVQGASIELSADAPMKPPYTVFFQGGLTHYHARIGIDTAIEVMKGKNLI
ncbi:MAG: hypothetical protein ATN31_08085 [Candidatus Epulonipiscioides saccharophilum]|nr:MAG: hypothetical protein ATN31_08085 [Epulopiscium sp. AS2M-Bin001]